MSGSLLFCRGHGPERTTSLLPAPRPDSARGPDQRPVRSPNEPAWPRPSTRRRSCVARGSGRGGAGPLAAAGQRAVAAHDRHPRGRPRRATTPGRCPLTRLARARGGLPAPAVWAGGASVVQDDHGAGAPQARQTAPGRLPSRRRRALPGQAPAHLGFIQAPRGEAGELHRGGHDDDPQLVAAVGGATLHQLDRFQGEDRPAPGARRSSMRASRARCTAGWTMASRSARASGVERARPARRGRPARRRRRPGRSARRGGAVGRRRSRRAGAPGRRRPPCAPPGRRASPGRRTSRTRSSRSHPRRAYVPLGR